VSFEGDLVACFAVSTVADAGLQHFVHFSGHFQTRTSFEGHPLVAVVAAGGESLTVRRQISVPRFAHLLPHRYCTGLRLVGMLVCRGFR